MSSPTQRSLDYLRKNGYLAAVIEQWITFPDKKIPGKMIRIKRDVFGADILFFHPETGEVGLCQTTTRANQSARIGKSALNVDVNKWLKHHTFVVHGWALAGARGKRKLWEVSVHIMGRDEVASASEASDAAMSDTLFEQPILDLDEPQ